MSESVLSVECWSPQQAHQAMTTQIWPMLKAMTYAGRPMVLELRQQKRSLKENAMLHAMLTYISKHMDWAGAKRDVDTWKRLMVAAWCRARREQIEILPAIDGHGVDIVFRKTSKLNKAECAELIEFVFAWCAMQGLVIPEPKRAGHASPLGAALAPVVARSDKGNNTAAVCAVKPQCGGYVFKEAAWHD